MYNQRDREVVVATDETDKKKVLEVEGQKEFIWVGTTEPKANLNRSNNGLSRVQREGRLTASVGYISQHKQLRAAAFVPRLFILFLFWQLCHNAGVGLALTGRVCAVCRQDVGRLRGERERKKKRPDGRPSAIQWRYGAR